MTGVAGRHDVINVEQAMDVIYFIVPHVLLC